MGLRFTYTLIAPLYDAIVDSATQSMRKESLQRINSSTPQNILINGIGTGLDIPHLPDHHRYQATDLTPAMLKKCEHRLQQRCLDLQLHVADVMNLPFEDDQFDIVVMNLIVAVVPDPLKALQEACRVVKPGGKIYIMDKFIRKDQPAPLLRFINIFIRHIATRTDVILEDLVLECPQLKIINDEPAILNGWFRLIDLEKQS